jgi:hypothetical protein
VVRVRGMAGSRTTPLVVVVKATGGRSVDRVRIPALLRRPHPACCSAPEGRTRLGTRCGCGVPWVRCGSCTLADRLWCPGLGAGTRRAGTGVGGCAAGDRHIGEIGTSGRIICGPISPGWAHLSRVGPSLPPSGRAKRTVDRNRVRPPDPPHQPGSVAPGRPHRRHPRRIRRPAFPATPRRSPRIRLGTAWGYGLLRRPGGVCAESGPSRCGQALDGVAPVRPFRCPWNS